jgi:predicted nucleic acid-binding protein
MITRAALIALLCFACMSARADTIYSEDFQSGKSEGWLAM